MTSTEMAADQRQKGIEDRLTALEKQSVNYEKLYQEEKTRMSVASFFEDIFDDVKGFFAGPVVKQTKSEATALVLLALKYLQEIQGLVAPGETLTVDELNAFAGKYGVTKVTLDKTGSSVLAVNSVVSEAIEKNLPSAAATASDILVIGSVCMAQELVAKASAGTAQATAWGT